MIHIIYIILIIYFFLIFSFLQSFILTIITFTQWINISQVFKNNNSHDQYNKLTISNSFTPSNIDDDDDINSQSNYNTISNGNNSYYNSPVRINYNAEFNSSILNLEQSSKTN